ncbi:hypothetical protein ACMYYO_10060 [Dermacoccaceae bacterium W4C1]
MTTPAPGIGAAGGAPGPADVMEQAADLGDLGEPMYLGCLSDEELVFLDAEHPMVQLPHHDSLEPAQRAMYVHAAGRGLRTRGYQALASGEGMHIPEHIADLLDVRSGCDQLLLVQVLHTDPEQGPQLNEHYFFVVQDVLLVEDVTVEGVHDFWVAAVADLPAIMQARVPLSQAQDGRGDPFALDLAAVAAGEDDRLSTALGQVLCQVDVARWNPEGPPDTTVLAVLLGARGSLAGRQRVDAPGPVTFTPIGVGAVGECVAAVLDGEE